MPVVTFVVVLSPLSADDRGETLIEVVDIDCKGKSLIFVSLTATVIPGMLMDSTG